jgi:site-specific recombinase XerD
MRKYVKELAMLAGLSRKIKVHTARHTFAIMLIEKGFSIDEVAQLLGDSRDIARIYARITNTHLHNKFKERLG